MKIDLFDYELPPASIAQSAVEPRDSSRLLVVNRATGLLEHRRFHDILEYLAPGDLLVVNNTRVRHARLMARKSTGAAVEVLVLGVDPPNRLHTLVKPGRRAFPGHTLIFEDGRTGLVVGRTACGGRILDLEAGENTELWLERVGSVPLPPYIHTKLQDPGRYQTVYNQETGSAAAPTAGLHFTPELMDRARGQGIGIAEVTLHVGIDTFRPVKTEQIEDHKMHSEWYHISASTAEAVASCKGRIVAVGTTSVRTLESATVGWHRVVTGAAETKLYITPGYCFKNVDAMITNFHIPRSSLLVLVSSFAGRELIQRAYKEALQEGYRFLSLGDAMLLI